MQSGSDTQTKRHSFIGKEEDDPQSSDKIESSQSSDKSSFGDTVSKKNVRSSLSSVSLSYQAVLLTGA